jgi:hypothetical protein
MNFGLVNLTTRLSCNFDVNPHFLTSRLESGLNTLTRVFTSVNPGTFRILNFKLNIITESTKGVVSNSFRWNVPIL